MWGLLTSEFSLRHELEQKNELNLTPTSEDIGANYLSPAQAEHVVFQYISNIQYNVTGQVGAIGPNAQAVNNTFTQALQQAAYGLDLPALATELAILRKAMRNQATEVEHDLSVASIGAAESSAKKQDGAEVLENLKSAGRWAFYVATKVGTSIAAKAIKTAIDL